MGRFLSLPFPPVAEHMSDLVEAASFSVRMNTGIPLSFAPDSVADVDVFLGEIAVEAGRSVVRGPCCVAVTARPDLFVVWSGISPFVVRRALRLCGWVQGWCRPSLLRTRQNRVGHFLVWRTRSGRVRMWVVHGGTSSDG